MAGPCTGSASCPVAGKVDCIARSGKLDVDIGVAMGDSVARAVARVSAAVCSVTFGTGGNTGMSAMLPGNIRECRTVGPPAGGGRSVARSATVTRSEFGVTSLTIGRCTGSNGIYPSVGNAVCMATAGDATGEGGRPSSRPVDRAWIGEVMRRCARNVDHPIHVLRGVVKSGIGGIDVRVAVFADGARRESGMGRVGWREAVTDAATRGCQIIRLVPDG